MNDNSEKIIINEDDLKSTKVSDSNSVGKVIINVADLYNEGTDNNSHNISDAPNVPTPLPLSSMGKMLSLAALVIACLILVYYIAQPGYSRQIETVLVAYKNIASDLKNVSAAEAVTTIVQRMYSINLSNCPTKFQSAYRCHIDAWEKAIPVIKEAEELNGWGNFLRSFVVGLVGGYTGNFGMIAGKIASDVKAGGELKEAAARVDEEIRSTYDKVLKIAQNYGVDITPYTKI